MDGFGRKTVLVFCQILAGATCIVAAFVPEGYKEIIIPLTLAGDDKNRCKSVKNR